MTAAALVAAVILVIYGLLDPATNPFPRCPFLTLTGLQCPGCGTQRAIHALLHGNILAALKLNALMVASLPLLALLLVAEAVRNKHPRFHARINSQPVIISCLVFIMAWWIIRNVI